MKPRRDTLLLAGVLCLTAALPVVTSAQVVPLPQPDETVSQYQSRVEATVPASKRAEGAIRASLASVQKQIAEKTTSVAAPRGSSQRVNDALADFLPLVAFAVNSVSTADDKKSVTVAFNPLPAGGYGAVSVSATVTEPQVFEAVAQAIDQAVRDARVKAIQGGIDDFGDVTWSVTYGYQPRPSSWEKARTLWGRSYALYADLLQAAADKTASEFDLSPSTQGLTPFNSQLNRSLQPANGNVGALTFREISLAIDRGSLPGFDYDHYVALLQGQAEVAGRLDAATRALRFEVLPALIDNQFQLTLTATYRDPNNFVGQRTYGVGDLGSKVLARHISSCTPISTICLHHTSPRTTPGKRSGRAERSAPAISRLRVKLRAAFRRGLLLLQDWARRDRRSSPVWVMHLGVGGGSLLSMESA